MSSTRYALAVPTVELARMLRATHGDTSPTAQQRARDIRAELMLRIDEAQRANVQGIGVPHGAPERSNCHA